MLLQQFDKLRDDTARRRENAARLSASLHEIAGILPARHRRTAKPCGISTRSGATPTFQGLSREKFIRAMQAEGIPCSTGYQGVLDGLLDEAIASRGFKRLFSARRLKEYRDSFEELRATARCAPQPLR